jgi:ABC-2 type transport system permease protein
MIIALRYFIDRRRWNTWWVVGSVAMIFLTVAFYPSIKDQTTFDEIFRDAPEGVRALLGAAGDISLNSPAGYLHSQLFAQLIPIALVIFGTAVGARAIAGAEDDGTLELMLSNPVTRLRVAVERYASGVAMVVGLGFISTVALIALASPFELLAEGVSVLDIAGAGVAVTCFGILHASIAFAVGAVGGGRSRAFAVAAVIAVAGFIVFGLVSGGVITPARYVTPWWWYISRNLLAQGLPPESVYMPIGISAALAVIGIWRFRLRDLR